MGKIKILEKELKKLVEDGLKDSEICKILKCSEIGVYTARKRYGIIRPSFSENYSIKPTKRQLELLLGTLLGDSSFKRDRKNPKFSCEHGERQREYNYWKYLELKSLGAKYREYTRKTIDERTGKFYTSNVLTLKSNPEFLSISNELYKTGKKEITLEYLKNFSELSLAVLFMDDGSKTNHSIRVYTNSFSTESLNNFIKFTKDRWDISFNIDKLNQLYLPVKYYSLFKWLIKDYIHPSMEYKLH